MSDQQNKKNDGTCYINGTYKDASMNLQKQKLTD